MADLTYGPKVYHKQEGDELVVASGGAITIETGGTITYAGDDLIAEIAALSGLDATELGYLNGVTAGAVLASKAAVVDTNKDIGDFRNLDAVNIDAGVSGTAGSVDIFPATAASGKIQIAAADSAGDTTTTITNASQAAARIYTIPDAGTDASFVMTAGAQSLAGVKTFSSAVETGTVGVTGSALVLESLNPMTIKLNDTNALQLDNAAISAFAGAADAAGTDVYVETQDGGTDAAVNGANAGGAISIKTGDGGTAGADQHGAAGGAVVLTSGAGSAGGAHTANNPNGGNGGDITITAGAGGAAGGGGAGVAGDPGKIKLASFTQFPAAQVIDMADAAVTLTLNPGTPAGTLMTSNFLRVDANSGATENLLLPPEADLGCTMIIIQNTGGESIVVQNDAGGTVDTVATAEFGMFFCDGTSLFGMNKA